MHEGLGNAKHLQRSSKGGKGECIVVAGYWLGCTVRAQYLLTSVCAVYTRGVGEGGGWAVVPT